MVERRLLSMTVIRAYGAPPPVGIDISDMSNNMWKAYKLYGFLFIIEKDF